MKAIFNESVLQRFNKLMLPLALFWTLATIGGVYLPNSTIERFSYQFEPFFEIFHFGEKFGISNRFDGAVHSNGVSTTTLVPDPHCIKAIYRSDSDSFVSISDSASTTIVRLGGVYKSAFKLIGLTDTVATFCGYGKTYLLRLGHDDPLVRQETVMEAISDSVHKENEWHVIAHDTLVSQMNNIQNLGKAIDISEVANGTKIEGFRVNKIASDSLFAQLGIMNGDIIQSVNNKKLESYADALSIYGQVPQLRSIRITVLRNNLPKDIVYEITR